MENKRIVSRSGSSKKFMAKVNDYPIKSKGPEQLRTCSDDVTSTDHETLVI